MPLAVAGSGVEVTTSATTTPTEEVAMFSFSVPCPCCGEIVTAHDAGFTATTAEVEACSVRRAAGVVSDTVRKSAAYVAAVPTTTFSHRDGLVSFA